MSQSNNTSDDNQSDSTTIEELSNRRQYFRIDDKVMVDVCPITDQDNAGECFELSPEFNLISEFQMLDVESKHLLRSITDRDKNLGQFLRVLNKKLDALSRVVALSHQAQTGTLQSVNLSEGGIALSSDIEYQCDQRVAIKLILLPSYSGLLLEGRVLSCKGSNSPYNLHVAFTDISEPHQQLIARHIMRLQSKQKSHQTTPDK